MTKAQIKFGLALADDIRRIRENNVVPGGVIPLNTNIAAIIRFQKRTGCGYLPAPKRKTMMTDEQRRYIEEACRLEICRALDSTALEALRFGTQTSTTSGLATDYVMTVEKLNLAINRVRVLERQMNIIFVIEEPHFGPVLKISTGDGTRFEMSWAQACELHKHWPIRLHNVLSPDMAEFVPVSGVFGDFAPLGVPMPPYDMPAPKEKGEQADETRS